MPFEGEQQAIMRIGPAPAGSGLNNAASRVAAPADGSGSWTIPGVTSGTPGCWVTITAIGGAVVVVFGTSAVANATLATDCIIPQDSTQDYYCPKGTTTVKFASSGGTSTASVHRSSV